MAEEEAKQEGTEEAAAGEVTETPTEEAASEEAAEAPAEEPKEEPKAEEPKAEEVPAEEPKKEEPKPEPSGKFKELIKQIEELSVLDLAELVKALEERFGVSAAAPMAVAGAAGAAAPEAAEEKSTYTVVLASAGSNKIGAIKAVREITGLGLKEAKDLVEGAPKELKQGVPTEEANQMKAKIEEAGATAELK